MLASDRDSLLRLRDRRRAVHQGARCEATYYTMAGPVVVERSHYREVGQRDAKVVDSVSLRAGDSVE
jgi:hypothetical protein